MPDKAREREAAGERATVWHRIRETSRLHPGEEAVRWRGGCLSYQELWHRAEQIRRYLVERCEVGPGDAVGVALPRTGDLPATLLAVLGARAAYVPLDPTYPRDRLEYMISDAGCRTTVTAADLSDLPALPDSPRARPQYPVQGFDRPHSEEPRPSDLAYVIYTSGSTGRPKGVAIEHASVAALLDWADATFKHEELSGMLASTSICFDLSVFEIFVPLSTGGRVLLADKVLDLPDLDFFAEVRLINTVPSAMAELLNAYRLDLSGKTVALAGEAFPPHLPAKLDAAGAARILNLYGPTEDTVYSTWCEVDPRSRQAPPIGKAIAGTRAYVLDPFGVPCRAGTAGELHLAGEGLARGYLGRPELDEERFLTIEVEGVGPERVYRTGDRTVMAADGQLHYLGRADDQVKVRGHRIELGEVEALLGSLAGVTDCAATVTPGPGDLPALVAYHSGIAEPETLRSAFATRAPGWMVPSLFVRVDAIPRTLNGKRDRSALPAPRWGERSCSSGPAASAATPEESTIIAIFRQAFAKDHVDRSDSFVSLGGHSLLAVRVRAALERAFGKSLPLQLLFEHGSPAQLADWFASAQPQGAPMAEAAKSCTAALSPLQLRMWLATEMDPEDPSYVVTCTIAIAGVVEPARLLAALQQIVQQQPALRTAFKRSSASPVPVAEEAFIPELPLHNIERLGEAGAKAFRQERLDALSKSCFRLDTLPLFRAELLRYSPDRWELLFAVHHIVFDEWSLSVLTRALAANYAPTAIPAPGPASDARIAAPSSRIGRVAGSGSMAAAAGDEWALICKPDPLLDRISGQTAAIPTFLDQGLTGQVAEAARRTGTTPFMLLLGAFQTLLTGTRGPSRLATVTAADGRQDQDLDDRIGCFVRMATIEADIRPERSFTEIVDAAKVAVLAAISSEEPGRSAGGGAIAQVAIGFRNAPEPIAVAGDLQFTGAEVRPGRAHLPLTIWMHEKSGGIEVLWTYRTDRLARQKIDGLSSRFPLLLAKLLARPDAPIGIVSAETAPPAGPVSKSFPGARGLRAVSAGDLTRVERPDGGRSLPVTVRALAPGLSAGHWAAQQRQEIGEQLRRSGAVLLRDFEVRSLGDFRGFAEAVSDEIVRYTERSSPRTQLADGVYTSTDHPPDQAIVLHTEQSYTLNWPRRIMFYCEAEPTWGGRTPIADTRRVLARLSPSTRAAFERRGVLYVRNYIRGISIDWKDAFQTDSREEAESFCRTADIEVEWLRNDQLRTRQRRPAIRLHPETGEAMWFNHAYFFNIESLPPVLRDGIRGSLAEEDYPYQTYFGDGGAIPIEMLREIRAAYDEETVSFPWSRGDVLLLDNMLCAHGREPFRGDRLVRTIMADPVQSAAAYASAHVPQLSAVPQ